ncbi:type II secretion system F family protein [Actinomadura atramentaria]|uniref:type II secretion system F family protein n=1 Tax=Actinomadura atramentaria TaxID=1990 RepID=UPI000A02403A|nr:type II secretion system F family protein [Actinomadura atramentaria]
MIPLAVLCAVAAVWLATGPPPAARRLVQALRPARPDVHTALTTTKERVTALRDRRRDPDRWRTAVIELCDGMAAELTAGRAPAEAYTLAAATLDPRVTRRLPPSGADPPTDHLEALAAEPGAAGLRPLAACWRIGAERGGALGDVLDGLATALRDEEELRREVAAQLAAPRATARLLAALPLLGLAMAAAIGAHPVAFLFTTLPGLACLLLGTSLNATGLWWTHHLAKAAETPR